MHRYHNTHITSSLSVRRMIARAMQGIGVMFVAMLAITILVQPRTIAAQGGTTPPPNGFRWWMNNRFGLDKNADGLIDYHYDQAFIRETNFTVNFDVCPDDAERGRSPTSATLNQYTFTIDNGTGAKARSCLRSFLMASGAHTVTLDMQDNAGKSLGRWVNPITVKDILVVSLGDSFGSGEGTPDVHQEYGPLLDVLHGPRWVDTRCHRSASAGVALAARALEESDPHTSVTFLSLACSGATLSTPDPKDHENNPKKGSGLLGGYLGIEPGDETQQLPPQVAQLRDIVGAKGAAGSREIDHLVISIGGNDLQFSTLIEECSVVVSCYDEREHPEIVKRLRDRTAELPGRYDALAVELKTIPSKKVYLTEYPNLVLDDNGNFCDTSTIAGKDTLLMGLTKNEVIWMYNGVLKALNTRIMPEAVARHKWNYIGGVERLVGVEGEFGHGFCAEDNWFNHSWEAVRIQGPDTIWPDIADIKGTKGTIHPNIHGQRAYKERIFLALGGQLDKEAPQYSTSMKAKGMTSKVGKNGWIVGACDAQNVCSDRQVAVTVNIDDPSGLQDVEFGINGSRYGDSYAERVSATRWEILLTAANLRAGTNQIEVTATDREGYSSTFMHEVKWDYTTPTGLVVADREPDLDGFYKSPVGFSVTGQDLESAAIGVRYQIDGGGWKDGLSGEKIMISTHGTHKVEVYATDDAGRISQPAQVFTVKLDLQAPNLLRDITPVASAASYHNRSVAVVLRSDDGTGVGTESITYEATGKQPIAQRTVMGSAVTIRITANGTTKIRYATRDRLGNLSITRTLNVNLDLQAPTAALTSPAANAVVRNGLVTLSGTASDGVGLARVEFLVDDLVVNVDAAEPYSFGLDSTTVSDGLHNVAIRATDVAGNVAINTRPVIFNRAADTVITLAPARTTDQTSARFRFTALAAAATFECSMDNATFTTCGSNKLYSGLALGSHTFRVRAKTAGVVDSTPAVYGWQIIAPAAAPTTLISPDIDPSLIDSEKTQPAVSADGRFVAFMGGKDIVSNDTNNAGDIFVRDRDADRDGIMDEPGTAKIVRVSVSTTGAQSNGWSYRPALSADGRLVVFESEASNLVGGDTNALKDVFLHDRDTDADGVFDETGFILTVRVSVANDGTQGNGRSEWPEISDDGRHVVFQSSASTLVAGDTTSSDIFAFDRMGNTIVKISVDKDGKSVAGSSRLPDINANGRYVAFVSSARTLVANDANNNDDIYVHDRDADRDGVYDEPGATANIYISVARDGFTATAGSISKPAINGSGRYIAFLSQDSNLVAGDANTLSDAFIRDRDTDGDGVFDEPRATSTELVSKSSTGVAGDKQTYGEPGIAISGDGRYVAFASEATNLVAGDANNANDIFVHDVLFATTERASLTHKREQGDWRSFHPALSGNGGYIVYQSGSKNMVPEDTSTTTDIFATKRDIVAPDTEILVGPAFFHTGATATFTFGATEAGATFTCSVDNGAFVPCASGATVSNLTTGDHTFQVRATDASGNTDLVPAVRTFIVR